MGTITCGFIGLGLIGGSIARAIRERIPDAVIIAYDINSEATALARREGVADLTPASIDESFSACDYLFLCAPVQKNDENLNAVKRVLSPGCLLTDVGSVKTEIHRAVKEAGLSRQFVGGHPMAGSERVGYVNSKAVLLQNAYYILTPTDEVPSAKVEAYLHLVERLGALPLVLSCEQHDYVTAAVSHLPHVIAASLVNLVRDRDLPDGIMKQIAAGGFKDITRIASSSAVMWQQICLTNTANIRNLLSDYIDSLVRIREELDTSDQNAIYELFEGARVYRDSFSDHSAGPIKQSYTLKLDIADEPGALAHIATLLAQSAISIKNIGITHNREFEGGVLLIEFYEESSVDRAREILSDRGHTVLR